MARTKKRSVKNIKLAHHHAKPYRKRHIGLLAISLLALAAIIAFVLQYSIQVMVGSKSSADFVRDLFSINQSYQTNVTSTLGFKLQYDQKEFYASAIDGSSGELALGKDASESRPYSVVRLAPTIDNSRLSQSSFSLTYHNEQTYATNAVPNGVDLQALAFSDASITQPSFVQKSTNKVKIDGIDFTKATWSLKDNGGIIAQIRSDVVVYAGVVDKHPVTIVINYGLGGGSSNTLYDTVIDSIVFGDATVSAIPQTEALATTISQKRDLLDVLLGAQLTSAATDVSTTGNSEKLAALYGPSVVKIYNAYCMDIVVAGRAFLTGTCNAWTGSGFFVSQDGYIATNGHVASTSVKDIAIQAAVTAAAKGSDVALVYLLNLSTLKQADITGKTNTQALTLIVDALYAIPDAQFVEKNAAHNMLVALSDKEPDVTALLTATKGRTSYSPESTIEKAEVKAVNYRAVDGGVWGLESYKASDVAIIKIAGTNYPVAKLGSINDASQGADLMILGYPGNATNNGLVDSTSSSVTLTTGKVSSIKNATGGDKKLIETDTTIGHGNSGGPAFISSGEVVGIATYTADGSGEGNGVFNYIRDIKDLQDLAGASGTVLDTNSATQSEWQEGLDFFYTARYSKAVNNFEAVAELYPNHPRVQEFIATAEKRIANGEDVKDFPVVPVAVLGSIVLLGAGVGLFLIVRHKKHHNAYKAGVEQGTVQPTVPGAPIQQVTVVAPTPVVDQTVAPIPVAPVRVEPVVAAPVAPAQTPVTPPIATPAPTPAPAADNPWFNSGNTPSDTQK